MRPSLHPIVHRAQVRLNKLPPGAVILDSQGHAWQYGPPSTPYWYRAYGDDTLISSWDLTQIIDGRFTIIHPMEDQ